LEIYDKEVDFCCKFKTHLLAFKGYEVLMTRIDVEKRYIDVLVNEFFLAPLLSAVRTRSYELSKN